MNIRTLTAAVAVAAALSACSEPAQTVTTRRVDTKAWEGPDSVYTAGSWKAGDRTSWDEQMRTRAQAQNDYAKVK